MATVKDEIWRALKTVEYPGYNRDIVSFGLVQGVTVRGGAATVSLDAEQLAPEVQEAIVAAVERALEPVSGLERLEIETRSPAMVRPRLARQEPRATARPAGVRHVLAVGSGKGGVGKSTVSANLAVALARQGLRVGLLDADAYGPNIPRMMGVEGLPRPKDGKILPAEAHGVRLVSIGLMVAAETPLVWRGPMTDKMVRQFLVDVAWGDLDVLVVDLPPSTGDIPISLVKHSRVDGAVVVVTPQEVAADDALKAVGMFRRLEVPLLGVVENMSYFVCDECGTRHYLFGRGGGERLAQTVGAPFLGEIPLEPAVREGGDRGQPAALQPETDAGAAFQDLAHAVWLELASPKGAEVQQPVAGH